MIEKLQNISLLKGRSVAGVQVTILSEGEYEFGFVLLNKEKSIIEIEKSEASVSTIEELVNLIPQSTPVILSIDGKGFINKRVAVGENENENSILNQVLPNASIDNFYLQENEIEEGVAFASVVRRDLVDSLLERFKQNNIFIVDVSFGPFVIETIVELIDHNGEDIHAKGFQLRVQGSKLSEVKKQIEEQSIFYTIGNERVSNDLLIPFASGFNYFINHTSSLSSLVAGQKEEFFYKRLFSLLGWGILTLFFAALLINFLLFDHFNKQYNDLSYKVSQNKELISKLDKLRGELKMKEEFVAKSGMLKSSKQSYYSDRIADTKPRKILLTALNINSLQKKMKEGKEPSFLQDRIFVSGLTRRSTLLNDWIKILKKEEWIEDVEVINYNQESALEPAEFEIEVILKS